MSNLLHIRQRERERLQERRDQVYDELQRLYAQMSYARELARRRYRAAQLAGTC